MQRQLLKAKHLAEEAGEPGHLPGEIKDIETGYAEIIIKGLRHHGIAQVRIFWEKKPGMNLLLRLINQKNVVLAFLHNREVPFTNIQTEQDICMMKVKQKVSGCFRTLEGGAIFCRVRSYLSTARKQGWKIWDAFVEAISGAPRMLIRV